MVGEVKGIEMMGVLVAGRGARERGGRRLEVEALHTVERSREVHQVSFCFQRGRLHLQMFIRLFTPC